MALDLSGPKNPPPAKAPKTSSARQSVAKKSEREEGVNGVFQLAAAGLMLGKQHADAQACAMHGPAISHEVSELAEQNTQIAKVVDYITAVGPYAGLLAAVMPLALQIMVNHGRMPAGPLAQFGVIDPKALAAQQEADMARQAAEMMRSQQAAEAELAQMRVEANGHANQDTLDLSQSMATHSKPGW